MFVSLNIKRNLVQGLTARVKRICSPEAIEEEIKQLRITLRENGYPNRFILRHLGNASQSPPLRLRKRKRCCSSVGRQSESQPQTVSIAPHCEGETLVMHELGHVMGFWHEQSRPDRDDYVEIFEENIEDTKLFNYDKKGTDVIDSLGEPYDYYSIMHYHDAAFIKPDKNQTMRPTKCCPNPKIGHAITPSVGDIRQANKLYNCPSCGRTLIENSGTFAAPQADSLRWTAETNDQQHELNLLAKQVNKSQLYKEVPLEAARTNQVGTAEKKSHEHWFRQAPEC
nr:unnamed protein product [Spirometra erinaceieuropaei]